MLIQLDAGLVRALGPSGLAASIVSMMIGAGIFAAPSALAAPVGSYAPLALLACALGIGAVGICCAEGRSRVPTNGGMYGYIEAALGPLAGYVAGTLLWVGELLTSAAVAAALADVAASLVPRTLLVTVRAVVIVGVIAGIALVNVGGGTRGARLVTGAAALKLFPLLIFVMVGAAAVHPANFSTQPGWQPQALGRAVILAAFALMGMNASLCNSNEVTRPTRTIPLALAIALASVILLYIAIQLIVQGILGDVALAGVPLYFRPLGLAMGLGIGTMLLLIALASPAEITGLLVLVLGSAPVFLLQSRIVARGAT